MMAATGSSQRFEQVRPLIAGVALLLFLAGGAAYLFRPSPGVPAAPPPQAAAAPAPANPAAPSFDIVRVGPQGNAVIAGRAQPGADVVVRESGRDLGQARADQRGDFVIVPAAPIAPGGRELTLAARQGAAPEVGGEGSVLLVVPPAPAQTLAATPAPPQVALLLPNAGAPRLLQAPAPVPAPIPGAQAAPHLTLDTVDYDDRGEIRFTGSAAAAAPVRVYVDNAAVGDSSADEKGRWTLTPKDAVKPGVHQLRVDQLHASGRVLARVELPFQRTALAVADVAQGRVVVQPGQNLWRLARRAYGAGVRYTVIYLANREQIRDPRLIYPGQAFATPGLTP